MKVQKANLFESTDDWIFVTGNSCVRADGALVMGKGAASQLRDKVASLPFEFGGKILKTCGSLGEYNLIISEMHPFGIFQVKYHYKEDAELALIERSTEALNKFVRYLNVTVSINFPGIGNGNLFIKDVAPIIKDLDDRVTVYYL